MILRLIKGKCCSYLGLGSIIKARLTVSSGPPVCDLKSDEKRDEFHSQHFTELDFLR
jgi:hypothetical protein